jgi:hypothetical protein
MEGKTRAEQLLDMLADAPDIQEVLRPTIEEMTFLETRLNELRALPFIKYNPNNPTQQKVTPAARQYKELLQQYNNCVKMVTVALQRMPHGDSSPLAEFLERAHELLK